MTKKMVFYKMKAVIFFSIIVSFTGCGNPRKSDLLFLAPFLFVGSLLIACLAEYFNKRLLIYLISILFLIIFFLLNVLMGGFLKIFRNENTNFYFSVLIQSFIFYTFIFHGILKSIKKISHYTKKLFVIPLLSSLIVLLLFLLIIVIDYGYLENPGDLMVALFGWPLLSIVIIIN